MEPVIPHASAMLKPLSPQALPDLPARVGRPAHDLAAVSTGIVHFGPGAFHRAHQAHYVDRLLAGDPRWGIAAVSMRSAGTVEAMARQSGLYTLAILGAEPSYRVLGAHNRFLGPADGAAVRALLSDPAVRMVSSTVTEKGYCLAGDGTLDFAHPDIVHDLATPQQPRSLIGWIALGLGDRRAAGSAPFVPMCCDNMASNGRKFGAAVADFARRLDPELANWIAGEVRFPSSMVDSITPATDEAAREHVRAALGLDDAIPVTREAYAAWIVEDVLPPGLPDLRSAGVVLTGDVAAFERAKLRILNGAHSSLAYLGLLLEQETVAGAMNAPPLARFIERLVRDDIIPSLEPAFDLQAYASDILARFRNPAIAHKLAQIAWDGSQKLPYRLLGTVTDALAAGRPLRRLLIPIAAWMLWVERQARAGIAIVDPLGDRLSEIGRGGDPVGGLLGLRQVFPASLAEDPFFRGGLEEVVAAMRSKGVREMVGNGHA